MPIFGKGAGNFRRVLLAVAAAVRRPAAIYSAFLQYASSRDVGARFKLLANATRDTATRARFALGGIRDAASRFKLISAGAPTIARVQTSGFGIYGGTATKAVTMPSTPTAGNLLIAYVMNNSGDPATGAAVLNSAVANQGTPSTFSLGTSNHGLVNTTYTQIGWLKVPSGLSGAYTVTFTFSSNAGGSVLVEEWSSTTGWQTTPNDTENAGSGSSTTAATGSVTASADDLVVACVVDSTFANPATFTSTGTGFTNGNVQTDGATTMACATASRPVSTGATAVPSGTVSNESWTIDSSGWRASIQGFKANPGGGANITRDVAIRFRLIANSVRDTVGRFKFASPTTYRDLSTRLRLVGAAIRDTQSRARFRSTGVRDAASRFRQRSATAFRNTSTRLLLASAVVYRDTTTRWRLLAQATRDTAGRYRLRALALRDATLRFAQSSQSVWRHTGSRFLTLVGGTRDTSLRLKILANATRDTADRFRLVSAVTYRFTSTRLRLLAQATRDTATRLRLQSPTTYRDTVLRARFRAQAWRDTAGRFSVRSVTVWRHNVIRLVLFGAGNRDTQFRFRISAVGLRDANARLRLLAQAWRHTAYRFALRSPTVYRDTGFRARLIVVLVRDTASRLAVLALAARDQAIRFLLRAGQTTRPSADVSVGGWTTDTGATTGLFSRVNEVVPDTTNFIQSSVAPVADVSVLALDPLSDPGVDDGYRLSLVLSKDVAGGRGDLDVALLAGVTSVATRTITDVGSAWVQVDFALGPTEVQAFRTNGGFANPRVRLSATQVTAP